MRRKNILVIMLAVSLFVNSGISGMPSAYAMEAPEEKEERPKTEITFPEFRTESAVNDAGNTVMDDAGGYWFREYLTLAIRIEETEGRGDEDGEHGDHGEKDDGNDGDRDNREGDNGDGDSGEERDEDKDNGSEDHGEEDDGSGDDENEDHGGEDDGNGDDCEQETGRFTVKREGEELVYTDGYFKDVLYEEGEYVYTLVYAADGKADLAGEKTLTVTARKGKEDPFLTVGCTPDPVEVDGRMYMTEDPKLTLGAGAPSGIALAEYKKEDGEYEILKDFRTEDNYYEYGAQESLEEVLNELQEFEKELTDIKDGGCRYAFRITDVLGGTAESETVFFIDKTAPDRQVFVNYRSDGTSPDMPSRTGIMDFAHSVMDRLFGKKEVWFDLYVTDGQGQSSGIDTEDLCSQIETAGGRLEIRKAEAVENEGVSFTYEGNVYEGYAHVRGCLAVPSGRGQDQSDCLRINRLRDRAGNRTDRIEAEEITGATVVYMDQTSPVLFTDYGEGIVDEEKKTVFYGKEARLKCILTERNYFHSVKEDGNQILPVIKMEDGGTYGASAEEWRMLDPEGTQVYTDLIFPAVSETGEAVYDFTIAYQDGAGNLLGTNRTALGTVKDGIYTGYTVVTDNRPPKLTEFSAAGNVTGQYGGADVYQNVKGDDVRFSFAIDDHEAYWNADAVKLVIWDQKRNRPAMEVSGSELQWTEDGRSHRTVYGFDGEEGGAAGYRVMISYEDCAGNRLVSDAGQEGVTEDGVFKSREFILDHEPPGFSITFRPAVRLVKENDTDPSQDIRDQIPRTGYTAYYNGTIEVLFSIRESCAVPVFQGTGITGLEDFGLTVTGKNSGSGCPVIDWKKTGDLYEGSFSLVKEDRYTIAAQYSDMAGNASIPGQVDGSRWESEPVQDGNYESVFLVLDQTAPVLKISYVDMEKKEISAESVFGGTGCKYFSEPVYLKLEAEDENLRFHELLCVLEKTSATDHAGNRIPGSSAEKYLEHMDGTQISENGTVWLIPLTTEAICEIPVACEDLSGNRAEQILERVCVDETEPELELSYKVEKSGFLDAVRYRDFRYLFADGRMTIRADAKDRTAGVQSIRYRIEEETGELTEKVLDFEPTESGCFEITIPSETSDFKGMVTAEVLDWCQNSISQKCGHMVEGKEKHQRTGSAVIVTKTAPSRTVGGVDYYNTDITFELLVRDTYSGLKNVSCKGGKTIDWQENQDEKADGVPGSRMVYEYQKKLVLDAAANNENEVLIRAEYLDHAGHVGAVEQLYNIDITAPVIQVEYDNDRVSGQGLYAEGRTAAVTIRERNFDPSDVEFQITNTDGTMPSISDWSESGAGDDTLHTCYVEFPADGDYTFTVAFTDLAGNRAEYTQVDEFTIDQTEPEVTVTYMNESGSGPYFAHKRMAVINVLEHNFDADLIQIMVTEQSGMQIPSMSGWSRNGDHSTTMLLFDADGAYTFGIAGTDLAGNRMNEYGTEHFVIDQTDPELEISGLEHMSANKGEAAPVIRCTDTNYQEGSMKITLEGCLNGETELKGRWTRSAEGETFSAEDFAYIPESDDRYRLLVSASDLAGNTNRREIQFSVNRFGSVYTFDEKTEILAGDDGIYYTNKEQDIVITETNVDTLEFLEITCNRNGKLMTLKQGEDYEVYTDGTDMGWKQYTYTIPGRNFTEEGTYILTLYSEDRAENVSDNQTKGKKIEFVVDKTAPSILLSGLEDGGQYRENSREITLDIQDNVRMAEVKVKINGATATYHPSEVLERDGRITLMAGSANRWQTIRVTAFDAAGNQRETEKLRFLLTPDLLVQFLMDRMLVCRSMAGLILIWGGTWFLFFRRHRNRFRKWKQKEQ